MLYNVLGIMIALYGTTEKKSLTEQNDVPVIDVLY